MSVGGELVVAAVMVLGLAGVVLPVLPGLLLIWAAAVGWAVLDGGGAARWAAVGVVTALLVLGTVVKYALPARRARRWGDAGAPRSTLLVGAMAAVVGLLVIPVVGLLVGGVLGVLGAELVRLGDAGAAWRSTRAVLLAVGLGMLAELAAGLLMVATWAVAAVLV
jgi:uncharacterized protein YqgC (DUF456 family)